MQIPTNAIDALVLGVDLAIEASNDYAAYQRIANGITAKAQAENRNVTEEEEQIINAMLDDAVKQRRGQA